MACYNAEAFVRDAIESVLNQTFTDYELIIVDDGSTDRSAEVISSYVRHNVTLLRQGNQGASVARNRAFQDSVGEFVIFMDADDVISPRHIESLLARAEELHGCIALSRWDRFHTSIQEAACPDRPTEQDLPGVDWLVLDWANARPMTQSGMLLLPRHLLEAHGGWNEHLTLLDDFEFFARLITRSNGIRFAPSAMLYYRSGLPNSLSKTRSRRGVESALDSLILGTRHLLAVEDSERTRRVCANLLQDFQYAYYPDHADLRGKACARVAELGGSSQVPDGPPGFHRLRRLLGWKVARRAQILASKLRG
jgi:glycosyltransferase involved in cell wall biosynthesis